MRKEYYEVNKDIVINGKQLDVWFNQIKNKYPYYNDHLTTMLMLLNGEFDKKDELSYFLNENRTINSIDDEGILFSDGSIITYESLCDYGNNYADFSQLDDLAKNYIFKGPILFDYVDGYGFSFGDSRRMFFVPCYSEQNGYYSDEIDIYYNTECVLHFSAEML